MSGVIAYLLAEGMLNDADAKTSPLVTAGWGEWFGVRWVVLHGMTVGTEVGPDDFVFDRRPQRQPLARRSSQQHVMQARTGQRQSLVDDSVRESRHGSF